MKFNKYGFAKYFIFVLLICFFVLYFSINIVTNVISFTNYKQINHFNNISECYFLDEFIVENKTIQDKYIEGKTFTKSYIYKCRYNNIDFDIYAYEFSDIKTAKDYYSLVTGKKSCDGEFDYVSGSNLITSRLIARYNHNVYRIKTGTSKDFIEVMKLLNNNFCVEIR